MPRALKQDPKQTREPIDNSASGRTEKFVWNWNPVRVMQLSFISAVVLVAFSIFHYLVILAPKKEEARKKEEQVKIELQQQEIEAKTKLETARVALELIKEQRRQEEQEANKMLLDDCLITAYKTYTQNWAIASAKEALRPSSSLRSAAVSCVVSMGLDNELCWSLARYADSARKNASSNYDPSASLPAAVADNLNANLYRDRDQCLKMYPR